MINYVLLLERQFNLKKIYIEEDIYIQRSCTFSKFHSEKNF